MAHYPEVLNNFPEAYFIPRYPTFLYEYKNTKTKKIAEISYEIVDKLFEKFEEQKSDWVKVKTIDGLTGYVFNKPVDWPSHPLMCLRKQEKTWQIQYLFID
ncbi:MAG: SH3 domain-containing protein [Pseudomonadota bacterium]